MVSGSAEVMTVFGIGAVAALSYLIFNLFTPPCFAAIGSMNSEMESPKWLWGAIAFQLGTGYSLAFIVYQFGTLFSTGSFGAGFLPGLIAVSVYGGIRILSDQKKKVGNGSDRCSTGGISMLEANIAIALVLAGIFYLAIRKIIKDKKKGVSCGGCAGCPIAGQCEGSH